MTPNGPGPSSAAATEAEVSASSTTAPSSAGREVAERREMRFIGTESDRQRWERNPELPEISL
ncbi:hypothetical protein GCM10010236_11070 [Streptomyces eurythermus]|nr:hypothetical protein GCM10010236_11070 [Streptomyces eurythermus]